MIYLINVILVGNNIMEEVNIMCNLSQGIEENGRKNEIFQSVQDRDYSVRRGAEKLGITEEEFKKCMEEAGYKVPDNS